MKKLKSEVMDLKDEMTKMKIDKDRGLGKQVESRVIMHTCQRTTETSQES